MLNHDGWPESLVQGVSRVSLEATLAGLEVMVTGQKAIISASMWLSLLLDLWTVVDGSHDTMTWINNVFIHFLNALN